MSGSESPPRVAVSGCGYWGKNLVRVFYQLGALAAVHDPDPVAEAAMTEAHRVPARAWEDLLADDEIAAVAIAAPAARHGALTNEALSAGKHVFVMGLPARRIGWVSHAGLRLGRDLVCPRTGRRYRQAGPDHLAEITEEDSR